MTVYQSKYILVHIPKTSGQSINTAMNPADPRMKEIKLPDAPFHHHWTAGEIKRAFPKEFESYFKFAVVRHPLDRIVSEYSFYKTGRMGNKFRYWGRSLVPTLTFSQFISDVKDHCWDHPEHGIRCRYYPQVNYLYDGEGNLMVDKVFRFEDRQEIDDFIFKTSGKKVIKRNRSTHDHYLSYYTRETLEVAQTLYKEDFDTFGYARF